MSQTDAQTTCDSKTALCTIMHHEVKINNTQMRAIAASRDIECENQ